MYIFHTFVCVLKSRVEPGTVWQSHHKPQMLKGPWVFPLVFLMLGIPFPSVLLLVSSEKVCILTKSKDLKETKVGPCCFQLYYPTSQGLKNLLQALDTDGRLDLLPTIWKGERAGSREDRTVVSRRLEK